MLLKDLITVAKNARWVASVLAPSEVTDYTFRRTFSEESYIKDKPINAARLLKAVAMGEGCGTRLGAELFTVGNYDNKDEVWIFVNGICTDRNLAIFNARCLSELFERTITVTHNATHGIVSDLVECAFERTLDAFCNVSRTVYREVVDELFKGKRVKLIGHSQGGIIVERVLKQLKHMELGIFKNIEIYTFGSGADEAVAVKGVKQEHFANTDDFVSRIGVLSFPQVGDVYVRDSVGHLLNRDYLEHFASGYFCGKTSRLYHLAQRSA